MGLKPVRPGTAATGARLTAQELTVARLAARGPGDREVADELVVSIKTIRFLRNVFQEART